MVSSWYVYILGCADGGFYTGHTEDVEKRLQLHNAGRGAAYTAARRPVELLYHESLPSKAMAIKREQQIKRWSRSKKQALIDGDMQMLKALAKRRG